MKFLKKRLQGYQPYVPGWQPADGEDWVKLNTNESPWPPSPKVVEAIRAAAGESLRLYPSPLATPARRAIAKAYGVEEDMVALANGGDELLEMAFRAFAGAGDRVAFPVPSYPLLDPLCDVHEVEAAHHELDEDWSLPAAFAADPAPLKFLVNPNSPTGTWFSKAEVERVLRESRGVVLLDEAYVDFAPETRVDLLRDGHENLVILRTLSKSFALAGLRVGFALASPGLIAALDVVKDSYNLDRLAIAGTVAAVEDMAYHDRLVEFVVGERTWLADRLRERGFEVAPSATNFVFTRPPRQASEVAAALKKRRVLVRHYDRPPIDGWFRITIGTREQHERLLAALQEILV